MKKLLQMKFMLLLCALIVGSGTMWAEDAEETIASFSAPEYYGGTTNNWTVNSDATYQTAGGGYYQLIKNTASITTPSINWSDYKNINITITARKYGGPNETQGKISVNQGSTELTSYSPSGTSLVASSALTISPSGIGSLTIACLGASSSKGCGVQSIVIKGTKSSGGGDTPTTWTVTYDGNGATSGSVPVDNTEYDSENSTVTVLGNTGSLAKEHYTFNNWNTADDGSGTGYVAGNTFTISGNTTLYAQWAINSHNVTLPAQNEFGAYTMSAVNPVAYGTEVTLTYNPASGYEKYVAAWSVNGTALEGNKFTMPDEDVTVTVELTEITIDFESAATAYTDWTFTNIVSNYSTTGVTAHGGSKYGSTDGKASGSIQTKERVNPASLTCYVSKQTNNTSSSTWYIQVSSDGSTWTDVTSNSATDMDKGTWKKITADLKNYSDVYVRVYYSGSTAVRLIDDLTLVLKNDTRAEAGLAFDESSYSVELFNAASFASPVLQNPNELSPITWTSTNETVATVNEGTVTILGEGETTIKAKFEGNDDYKPGEASYVLTVQDSRLEPTVTIHDTFITHTNVFEGTAAGKLTASVTYNDAAIEGATVTWSGDNDAVATINATSGSVDLVAAGTVTFTATYAGNSDYAEKTATYEMTVTYSDPNAPGTVNNPYTVAQALENTPSSGTSANVYIKGIVSKFYGNNTSVVDDNYHRYYISDEGVDNELIVFNGKGLNNTAFSSADDLQIGDKVVICGGLTMYNNASEVAANNYIVSLVRKPAAPTFSPAAGTYTSVQTVTISAADGATIYYTTNGTDPTTESTQYSEPIAVNETTTIKAIAVKDSEVSDVATAEYVIDLTPSIVFDDKQSLNVLCTAGETDIHFVASNITGTVSLVICDANGGAATYDWFSAELYGDSYVKVEWDANGNTQNRTAYFKLTSGNTTSDIFAVTQGGVDYATLPFEFDGGRSNIASTTGLTQNGLDSDYSSSPKLKFNDTGDWMILKINEAPGTLTFDIKGNTFSGGTFTVQTSADGVTYTDIKTYTTTTIDNNNIQNEEINNLASDVRYIKWIYTSKSSGNVALGNIKLAKPSTEPVITVADPTINVAANEQDFTRNLTYENITITGTNYFGIQYYNANNEEVDEPEWIVAEVEGQGSDYVLSCFVEENTGDERTAYLKVFATAGEEDVYSNLVTITQAKPVETVTYTLAQSITPGKHYIIASGTDGKVYVMGGQKSTNREAVEVEITTENVISVTDEKICEFIVSKDGEYYTFFDENLNGYLNATGAGGTSNNHLKTLGVNDNKGQWSISIGDGGVAKVIANATGRNTMRFNNGSSKLFSCYSSGQEDIYLFEKNDDERNLVIPIAAACTDGSNCFGTFSSTQPFVVPDGLTISEVEIQSDGTMQFSSYATGDIVPANTGVMVSAAAGDRSYVVNVSIENEGTPIPNFTNALRPSTDDGITADEMAAADESCVFYRLTMHNGTTIGFWWGNDGGNSFDIAANKAYLAVSASVAGARNGFAFGDDATGINNVNINLNDNDNCYDLQGRKVSTPGKGLYIVNGKKVVIK